MFQLISGPLVWLSFVLFLGGSFYRFLWMLKESGKDRTVFPSYMRFHESLPSLLPWLTPFANLPTRNRPVFVTISWVFHLCLVVTPVFLLPHNLLWHQSWGLRVWSLPEPVADSMTLLVILAITFFIFRRLFVSEVHMVTSHSDYLLLGIVLLPFVTGFLAHHQIGAYKEMLIIHILSGEFLLIIIPFTRLTHMLFFFFPRAYMGSEFKMIQSRVGT